MLKLKKLREINARNIYCYMLKAGYLVEVYWSADDYYVVALVDKQSPTGKYFKKLDIMDELYGLKACCRQKAMAREEELKLLWNKEKEMKTAEIEFATDQLFAHMKFLNSLSEGLGKGIKI